MKRHQATFERVLGTFLEIQIEHEGSVRTSDLECMVFDKIDELEAIFSVYRLDSELMLWQARRGISNVSADLFAVLEQADRWMRLTNFAFNPAVQSGAITTRELPWRLDPIAGTAEFCSDTPVTLNAIAKGHIVDQCVDLIVSRPGIRSAMINLGGDLRHSGSGRLRVGITDPRSPADNAPPLVTIQVQDEAVATSGGYRRGNWIDGVWHSHLTNPQSGISLPAATSVSVIAPDAASADALSTAFSVLSPTDSMALADQLGNVGVFIFTEENESHANAFWRSHVPS